MNHNKFFIQQYSFDSFFHGGIGYADAERILIQNNFTPVAFPHYKNFSLGAKISRFFYLLKMFFVIKKGATVIFIFPVFARMSQLMLRLLQSKKNTRIVCFVADIDGIKDGDKNLLEKEIEELKRYKFFIVHNDSMRQWLLAHVPEGHIATIQFFDFLAGPFQGNRQKNNQVVFAGNLAKSTFLEKLYLLKLTSPRLFFNLYGPGCTGRMRDQENVSYKGIKEPYELPSKLDGSFGLVWDGDDIEMPGGSLGDYMKYISHHKLSLYILGGLPLIVPEMAASAPLVKKYNIGLTIANLYEIQDKIDGVSEEQYELMRYNMKSLAQKISAGNFLSDVIAELMKNK